MQVKPRFENYRIIESYPIIKDDYNNELCLTLLEVIPSSSDYEIMESGYKYWVVCANKPFQWSNTTISLTSEAFWKEMNRELIKTTINGFTIEEVIMGKHRLDSDMLSNEPMGLRTTFILKRTN